jgi:hypothetical protein
LLLNIRFLLLKQLLAILEFILSTSPPGGIIKAILSRVCNMSDRFIFHWHFIQLLDLGGLIEVRNYEESVRAKHFQIICGWWIVKVLIILFLLWVALFFFYLFFLLMLLSFFVLFLRLTVIIFFLFFLSTT